MVASDIYTNFYQLVCVQSTISTVNTHINCIETDKIANIFQSVNHACCYTQPWLKQIDSFFYIFLITHRLPARLVVVKLRLLKAMRRYLLAVPLQLLYLVCWEFSFSLEGLWLITSLLFLEPAESSTKLYNYNYLCQLYIQRLL